jgi:hypothetical protein
MTSAQPNPDPDHLLNLILQEMDFDPEPVVSLDGYLKPHLPAIATRWRSMRDWQERIDKTEGGMEKFSRGYERFGLNVGPNNEVVYREWAPNAVKANLIGDFSEYHVLSVPLLFGETYFVLRHSNSHSIRQLV